ncbi:hypothetical protein GCM10010435_65140 [Winogradskya consettensis]|uniref:Uncharacterized protein n=1 Tax=Winogradskya consettensis TaxID=113560 RepID=A0A919W206_9ACTN|nr:hypothetical protein Aco04nite_92160 [Actinoplanes consettensis]
MPGSSDLPVSVIEFESAGDAVGDAWGVPEGLAGAADLAGPPLVWIFLVGVSVTAGVADGPTASPCVVTGKACPIDA